MHRDRHSKPNVEKVIFDTAVHFILLQIDENQTDINSN